VTALASPVETTLLGWEYFVDEVVGGEWADTPAYAMLWTIEHGGHTWVTDKKVILRSDLLPAVDTLPEDDRPTLTAYAPTPDNDILARLDDPWIPSRHGDVVEGPPLFEAGLLGPLHMAGLQLADDVDARLPQPVFRRDHLDADEVVGLLMPVSLRRDATVVDSIYVMGVSSFLVRAHDALATQWAALADVCDRDVWNAAAALENSGAFAQIGDQH